MLFRKNKRNSVNKLLSKDEELELRSGLVFAIRQILAVWHPAFATDVESIAKSEQMRIELEKCGDALECMFFRSSSRIIEYSAKIETAVKAIKTWHDSFGGGNIVSDNIQIIKDYINRWKEL